MAAVVLCMCMSPPRLLGAPTPTARHRAQEAWGRRVGLRVLIPRWGRILFWCRREATATRPDSAPESRTGLPLPELVDAGLLPCSLAGREASDPKSADRLRGPARDLATAFRSGSRFDH